MMRSFVVLGVVISVSFIPVNIPFRFLSSPEKSLFRVHRRIFVPKTPLDTKTNVEFFDSLFSKFPCLTVRLLGARVLETIWLTSFVHMI